MVLNWVKPAQEKKTRTQAVTGIVHSCFLVHVQLVDTVHSGVFPIIAPPNEIISPALCYNYHDGGAIGYLTTKLRGYNGKDPLADPVRLPHSQ